MTEPNGKRYCDRCGILLTKDNNKCGYELCDKCNEWLERYVKEHAESGDKCYVGRIGLKK